MTKGRRPSQEELKLWRWAMRQARPLSPGSAEGRTRRYQDTSEFEALLRASPMPRVSLRPLVVVPRLEQSARTDISQPLPRVSPPQLDHGLVRRVARGRRQIDAVLDLHGARQHEAYARLSRFIAAAESRGNRTLLVITGKGSPEKSGAEGAGVLRRMVPEWLRQAPMASSLSGFEPAHQRHGGGGALYVILRRNRQS